jgi:hypothetical protein
MSSDLNNWDDDYGRTVLACYGARHRSFVRIYTTFIAFSFGFVAFILAPMMALKLDEQSLPGEISQQEEELQTVQPRHSELKAKNEALHEELGPLSDELAKLDAEQAIKRREETAAREAEAQAKEQLTAKFRERSETQHVLHGVRIAMDPEKYANLQKAAKRIYDEKLAAAKALEVKITQLNIEEEDLQRDLSIVERELERIQTQRGILANRALPIRQQATEIETQAKGLEEKIEAANQKLKLGRDALTQMEQRRIDIQNRLSNVQSPVGALPLSLTEASLAFPFIVAVGFLICAILLADLLRLRCEYHRVVSAQQAIEAETIRHRLALVVPLWLDPLKTAWRNSGGAALVFLPALAYVVIIWLLTTDQFFDLEAKRLDHHLIRFYGVLYVVGVLFVLIGARRILAEWSAYRAMLIPEPPPAKEMDKRGQAP